MKIFLSFLQSDQQYLIPAYSFWQYYIKNGITEAGHTWIEHPGVDWALGIVPKSKAAQNNWKQQAWEKTLNWLKENPADLFLSYLYPGQIDSEAIRQIQNIGIPCVNFFCDNVREFKKIPIEFSAFDLNWVPEYKAVKLYQKAGYAFINLPMPIWITPGLRALQRESNSQVTFIGSKDIQRQLFFEQVVQKSLELPLVIYGKGWDEKASSETLVSPGYSLGKKLFYQYNFIKEHGISPYLRKLDQRKISTRISPVLKEKIHGAISFDDYNKLTAQSMITVGINRYHSYHFPIDQPATYSRLRDIEAPMLGACYLTEQTEGIETLYDIGDEIEVYQNPDDFIERAKALEADSEKRKRLKINGQKRALQDHSIGQSLYKIFQKLN
jgi:hypothetical protein